MAFLCSRRKNVGGGGLAPPRSREIPRNQGRAASVERLMWLLRSVGALGPWRVLGAAGDSHVGIVRSPAAFGRDPIDVLVRVLDVAGLAVDAVLRVDHVA